MSEGSNGQAVGTEVYDALGFGDDWSEEPGRVLIPVELTEPGYRILREHAAAVHELAKARDRVSGLQREDNALYKQLREGGGAFRSGEFEHPRAEKFRERRAALVGEIRTALEAVKEAEAEVERLEREIKTGFVPVRLGRPPRLPTEDSVQR